jgi:hypothetical protein
VDVARPPGDRGSCKSDRYADHADVGCASCHRKLDPIGFGLEQYGRDGTFRRAERDLPRCAIAGDGEIDGVGPFNGPAQLSELLIGSGKLEPCVVRQVYRFAMGHHETAEDEPNIQRLAADFARKGRSFTGLLVDIAAGAAFAHKRMEP